MFMALPLQSQAFTATLDSISPTPSMDISEFLTAPEESVVEVAMFGWVTEVGETYAAVFEVDENPGMVVIAGGDLDNENGSYAIVLEQ